MSYEQKPEGRAEIGHTLPICARFAEVMATSPLPPLDTRVELRRTLIKEPGKYDDLATHVRKEVDAEAVVILVHEGNRGTGCSVQTVADPGVWQQLAAMLRQVADEIDREPRPCGQGASARSA